MSIALPPGTADGPSRPPPDEAPDHILVMGHSSLLYWWPVWLVALLLAAVTYAEGDRSDGVSVSNINGPGEVFVATLLAVAFSSTVLLRGLVSVVAAVSAVAVAVLVAWLGWWGDILGFLGGLEVRINGAGYLCIGAPLLVAWVAVVTLYDPHHYVAFGRGQVRYVQEVGDSEIVLPAEGLIVEKKRSDAFRHWVLGLGAGDIVIRSAGRGGPTIELKNVLHVHRKMMIINKLLREKSVTLG